MTYPHNLAPTNLPILSAIAERWSPIAFSPRTIEPEKIATVFEAARWAPSSFNEQPWRYVYALKEDEEERTRLESLLSEGNAWAKEAGLLLISFAKKTFARNGKENMHFLHDLGCATGFLALQLPSLGLIGHQMAGFDRDHANGVLGVPDDFLPGSMMAIGYPGDPTVLPPALQERGKAPRVRRPQSEFAFRGKWTAR
ncbi:MAG: nitroreductase family protein [Candidatus Peribacteraceae bacterium]|jgi:nitroreductase